MRRSGRTFFLAIVLVWAFAGTATAASITVVTPNYPPSTVYYVPSDLIQVDVLMDGSGLPGTGAIASMFFHVDWSDDLSLVSVEYETDLPGGSWASLAGQASVDAYGLYTAQYDETNQGGLFVSQPVATLVFHVSDYGPAYVTPALSQGDAIGGSMADGYPDITSYFELKIIPEPGTALLLGLGLLAIKYARRRR